MNSPSTSGAWLAAVTRRLLHGDTFDLIVSPAIADLQFEVPGGGPAAQVRGYVAVWVALAGALWYDFDTDLQVVLDDVVTLLALFAIQASYYACMLTLLVAGMTTEQVFAHLARGVSPIAVVVIAGLFAASAIPTLLCFWPARR